VVHDKPIQIEERHTHAQRGTLTTLQEQRMMATTQGTSDKPLRNEVRTKGTTLDAIDAASEASKVGLTPRI